MENAIYGGRVDNTFDMRVLTSYLLQYFSGSVVTGQVGIDTDQQLILSVRTWAHF